MATTESAGSVSVTITGDAAQLQQVFGQLPAQAQAAGASMATAFNSGAQAAAAGTSQLTTEIDRLIQAIREESAAATLAEQRNAALGKSFGGVGGGAQHAGFSVRYAFLGLKDIAEGRYTFALAEAANQFTRIGGAALTAGIAIGAVAAVGYGIFKVGDYFAGLASAEKRAKDQAGELAQELAKVKEEALKLEDIDFEEAFGKAAASAKKASDLIATKRPIQTDIAATSAMLYEQQRKAAQVRADNPEMSGLFNQVDKGGIGSLDVIDRINLQVRAYAAATKEIETYTSQLVIAQAKVHNINSAAAQDSAKSAEEQQKQNEEASKKGIAAQHQATEALRKQDEDQLADLEASHRVTIAETISFWKQRQSAESGNAERTAEIHRTLGHLYQEQDRAVAEVLKHGAELMKKQGEDAEKSKSKLEDLALEAEEIANRMGAAGAARTAKIGEVGAAIKGQQEAGAAGLGKLRTEREYALSLDHSTAAQIAQAKAIMDADRQVAEAHIRAERAKAALETDEVKKLEADLEIEKLISAEKLRQYQDETKLKELEQKQSLGVQIRSKLGQGSVVDQSQVATANLIGQAVDGIASSLAKAVLQGKHFGETMAQLGKQLANSALTSVLKIGLDAILKSMLNLVPAFATVTAAQTAAAAAGKAVQSAADVAQVLSLAAVAAAGAAAAVAWIPVVGPALAAAAAATTYASIAGTYAPLAAFAGGTDSAPGGMAMVGEKGPEIMHVPRGAQIIPNHKIGAYASGIGYERFASRGSSSSVQTGDLHFHAHGVTNPDRFTEHVMRTLPTLLKSRSQAFAGAN